MGNNLRTTITYYDDKITDDQSKLTKFIKSKLKGSTSTKTNIYEDFIIQHQHLEQHNNKTTDLNAFDQKRTVFVSLTGLFQTYKQCPCYVLYTALLIMPLKQQWVYYPSKYIDEIQSHFISKISAFSNSDPSEIKQFIQLLKWKDTQGNVFWMLDDYENKQENSTLIDPFWFALNEKLIQLYDNISKAKYKPLNLNAKYWQNKKSIFGTKSPSILCELYFVTMKYKCVQEIIYDSNPKSLNVIKAYGHNNISKRNESAKLFDEFDNDENTENWWFSDNYDPYDLSDNHCQ